MSDRIGLHNAPGYDEQPYYPTGYHIALPIKFTCLRLRISTLVAFSCARLRDTITFDA